jgi:hypothetical protein
MNEVYCIYDKSTGEFLDFCFKTESEAQKEISSYDDEDAYLMQIVKMAEDEFCGMSVISDFYSCADAELIREAIEKRDEIEPTQTKKWLYEQISRCGLTSSFITKEYAEHFKSALLEPFWSTGGDEPDLMENKLMSFKEFLNFLRKEMDYLENE